MSRRPDESEFELDADARTLLAALRAEEGLPREVGTRVWSRLERDIETEQRRSKARLIVFVGLAIAAAVLLAFGIGRNRSLVVANAGDEQQAGYERAEPSPAPAVEREPQPVSAPTPTPVVEEPPPMPSEGPPPDKPSKPSRSVVRAAEPAAPSLDDLAEEAAMLRRAQRELVEGRPDAALDVLRQATARFESGALVPERSALEVVALCDAGRTDAGVAARREFLRRYPNSPLRARVREACGP